MAYLVVGSRPVCVRVSFFHLVYVLNIWHCTSFEFPFPFFAAVCRCGCGCWRLCLSMSFSLMCVWVTVYFSVVAVCLLSSHMSVSEWLYFPTSIFYFYPFIHSFIHSVMSCHSFYLVPLLSFFGLVWHFHSCIHSLTHSVVVMYLSLILLLCVCFLLCLCLGLLIRLPTIICFSLLQFVCSE